MLLKHELHVGRDGETSAVDLVLCKKTSIKESTAPGDAGLSEVSYYCAVIPRTIAQRKASYAKNHLSRRQEMRCHDALVDEDLRNARGCGSKEKYSEKYRSPERLGAVVHESHEI